MSIGSDKVEAAVHAVVAAHASCHSGLLVEVVFKLGIYVVQNGLPAVMWQEGKTQERWREEEVSGRGEEEGEHSY